jgi:hypothetical protein
MAGPGDEGAAGADGGRRRLRTSHADREQVISLLKTALVRGGLDRDEFDLRVGQALASRTCAELAALTTDIPAGLTAAQPPRLPTQEQVDKSAVKSLAWVTAAVVGALAVPFVVMAMSGGGPFPARAVVFLVMMLTLFSVPLAAVLLHASLGKRGGRQPAQGLPPGAGGEPAQRTAPADPTGQFPPIDPGQQHWLLTLKHQPCLN